MVFRNELGILEEELVVSGGGARLDLSKINLDDPDNISSGVLRNMKVIYRALVREHIGEGPSISRDEKMKQYAETWGLDDGKIRDHIKRNNIDLRGWEEKLMQESKDLSPAELVFLILQLTEQGDTQYEDFLAYQRKRKELYRHFIPQESPEIGIIQRIKRSLSTEIENVQIRNRGIFNILLDILDSSNVGCDIGNMFILHKKGKIDDFVLLEVIDFVLGKICKKGLQQYTASLKQFEPKEKELERLEEEFEDKKKQMIDMITRLFQEKLDIRYPEDINEDNQEDLFGKLDEILSKSEVGEVEKLSGEIDDMGNKVMQLKSELNGNKIPHDDGYHNLLFWYVQSGKIRVEDLPHSGLRDKIEKSKSEKYDFVGKFVHAYSEAIIPKDEALTAGVSDGSVNALVAWNPSAFFFDNDKFWEA